MHVVLRPAGQQMFDTRAWRGPVVVGADGIEPPTPLSWRNTTQAVEDCWFWQISDMAVQPRDVCS
jgi:hypothetical protein